MDVTKDHVLNAGPDLPAHVFPPADVCSPFGLGAKYQAWFFGPYRVLLDGRPLADPTWRRASVRTLLKWFLLNPGEPFKAAELCELLWPGQNQESSSNKMHVTLHYLRRLLEPGLPSRQASTFIRSDQRGHYWFDLSDCWWTDVLEVEWLSNAAGAAQERGDDRAAITLYTRLLDHYERTFLLEDIYDDAFASFRSAHEFRNDEVLHRLLRLNLDAGLGHEALSYALTILDRDPYSEDAVKAIAEIYLRQGNITAAIMRLDEFLRTVERDLGIMPSRDLINLRETICRT
jgi:DNA-binding SARP family transcriptional activator